MSFAGRISILGGVLVLSLLMLASVVYVRDRLAEIDLKLAKLETYAESAPVGGGREAALLSEERLTSAIASVTPGVVSILATKDAPQFEVTYIHPFGDEDSGFRIPTLRRQGTEERRVGAGTGFFVSSEGHIVTNKHVVDDEEARYTVFLQDGSEYAASVAYRDESADVAVLKIPGSGYPSLRLSSAGDVQIGQTVFAVGNALGAYDNSVSVGIVSGLNRNIEAYGEDGLERLEGVIQTDAAINMGNSGGPLADLDGRVIGINVAVARGSENIAFAIPIEVVRKALERAL